MAKAKPVLNPVASAIVSSAIALAKHDLGALALSGSLATNVRDAYVSCKTQAEFLAFFGSGGNNKLPGFVQGTLFATMAIMVSSLSKPLQDKTKAKLSQRITEARKIRAKGITLKEGETVQVAHKNMTTTAKGDKEKPAPEVQQSGDTDFAAIAKSATIEDMANMLSVFVATHPKSAIGLATALADFMPVSVKRMRKVS